MDTCFLGIGKICFERFYHKQRAQSEVCQHKNSFSKVFSSSLLFSRWRYFIRVALFFSRNILAARKPLTETKRTKRDRLVWKKGHIPIRLEWKGLQWHHRHASYALRPQTADEGRQNYKLYSLRVPQGSHLQCALSILLTRNTNH